MSRKELLREIEKEFGYGCAVICKERARQIEVEKWDYDTDKEIYKNQELAGAAACYAANAIVKHIGPKARVQILEPAEMNFLINDGDRGDRKPQPERWVDAWPWDADWDKREKHDRDRSLEISGALLAAQIDVNKTP